MEAALRAKLPGGRFFGTRAVDSRRMSAVRGVDTKPEMRVRRLVHSMGYRYRLHVRGLPGTPDMVFPSRRKVINVSGCFWHMHGCVGSHVPTKRKAFWLAKLERNKMRDRANNRLLKQLGWDVLTIWECQLRDEPRLVQRLSAFLE